MTIWSVLGDVSGQWLDHVIGIFPIGGPLEAVTSTLLAFPLPDLTPLLGVASVLSIFIDLRVLVAVVGMALTWRLVIVGLRILRFALSFVPILWG